MVPAGKSPGSLPTSRSLLLAMRSIFMLRPSTANDKRGVRLGEGAVPLPSAEAAPPLANQALHRAVGSLPETSWQSLSVLEASNTAQSLS